MTSSSLLCWRLLDIVIYNAHLHTVKIKDNNTERRLVKRLVFKGWCISLRLHLRLSLPRPLTLTFTLIWPMAEPKMLPGLEVDCRCFLEGWPRQLNSLGGVRKRDQNISLQMRMWHLSTSVFWAVDILQHQYYSDFNFWSLVWYWFFLEYLIMI
jgi:hypothetical protein